MNEKSGGEPAAQATVTIVNKKGLHARPAALFAKVAESYDADVTVSAGGHAVSARSIMGLLTLGASSGTQIVLEGQGPEAEAAIVALARLVENRFEEEDFPGY